MGSWHLGVRHSKCTWYSVQLHSSKNITLRQSCELAFSSHPPAQAGLIVIIHNHRSSLEQGWGEADTQSIYRPWEILLGCLCRDAPTCNTSGREHLPLAWALPLWLPSYGSCSSVCLWDKTFFLMSAVYSLLSQVPSLDFLLSDLPGFSDIHLLFNFTHNSCESHPLVALP